MLLFQPEMPQHILGCGYSGDSGNFKGPKKEEGESRQKRGPGLGLKRGLQLANLQTCSGRIRSRTLSRPGGGRGQFFCFFPRKSPRERGLIERSAT
jgi:hypothetical protein